VAGGGGPGVGSGWERCGAREGDRRGVGADKWAAAQCRTAVPLTGGSGLSVGTARGRVWAGPRMSRGEASPVE
jgi:hypothetical protein